jgi:hypothetical protein
LADDRALDLGALLPDELALWGRARINPALLDLVPGFLRQRLLPADLLGRLHPALAGVDAQRLLIAPWDGQLGGGLLGLDDDVALDPRRLDPAALSRGASGFAFVGLRDAAAARALVGAVGAALAAADLAPTPAQLGAATGLRLPTRPPATLLAVGAGALVVVGRGEWERLERVARGRLPAIAAHAAPGLERALVRGDGLWLGLGSTTGRLARAARRRGVPEHFVRMVASVAAATARLGLDGEGLLLEASLRPQPAEAP